MENQSPKKERHDANERDCIPTVTLDQLQSWETDEKRAQGRVGRSGTVHWQTLPSSFSNNESPYVVSYNFGWVYLRPSQHLAEIVSATAPIVTQRDFVSTAPRETSHI